MAEQDSTQEKNSNCAKCNKALSKIKRYYRNSKYYCGKRCFKDSLKETPKEEA